MSIARYYAKAVCLSVFMGGCYLFPFIAFSAESGGGSGMFKALPVFDTPTQTGLAVDVAAPFVPQVPSGVKFFKKEKADDADFEYEVWTIINSNLIQFRKFLSSSTVEKPWWPAWWLKKSPISDFIFKKGNSHIASSVVAEIEGARPSAEDYGSDPKWLLMENVAKESTFTFTAKVMSLYTSDNIQKIKSLVENILNKYDMNNSKNRRSLTRSIYKKIGETFLLMFFLGVTIEDCDLFVTFDPYNNNDSADGSVQKILDYVNVKIIDFGECLGFHILTEKTIERIPENRMQIFAKKIKEAFFLEDNQFTNVLYDQQIAERTKSAFNALPFFVRRYIRMLYVGAIQDSRIKPIDDFSSAGALNEILKAAEIIEEK
jgi:hypothetical protein